MTLEASFQSLRMQFQRLRDTMSALHVTIVVDKPVKNDVALVDEIGNTAEDLLGCLEEALIAAHEGWQAVEYPLNLHRARRALVISQQQYNYFSRRLSTDLMSYERISDLTSLGSERKGEWSAWSSSVRAALERCQQPSYDVSQALFICWQELAERVGMSSVFVQTTNIGQQVAVPEGVPAGEGVP